MAQLNIGSTPRFPSASKKRGMARAIEIVEWMKAYAEARNREARDADHFTLASVYAEQALVHDAVIRALRSELR